MEQREVIGPAFEGQYPLVLFVCRYNAGPSQIAEAYLRRFEPQLAAKSAGTTPSGSLDRFVVRVLAEDGVSIAGAFPKLVMPYDIDAAHYIVTIGTGVHGVRRSDEHWDCAATINQPIENIELIRALLSARVSVLGRRLRRSFRHQKRGIVSV